MTGPAFDVVIPTTGRERAGAPRGRLRIHALTAGAGLVSLAAALSGHRRVAVVAGATWLLATGELTWRRIAPGPRTREEVAMMLVTSTALPFAATGWWAVGQATYRTGREEVRAAPDVARDLSGAVELLLGARP
jgi:hypothetical protein